MNKFVSLTIVLIAILLTVAGFVYFFSPSAFTTDGDEPTSENFNRYFSKSGQPISQTQFNQNEAVVKGATELAKTGEYNKAATIFEEVVKSEGTYTATQISAARRSTIFRYRVTGEPIDSLQSIRDLKKNILDVEVAPRHQARSLNTLATAHCWFARDEKVINEIYGEAPFSEHWSGDPTLAVRNMLLWSFNDIYETPKAAASLAYWYMDQVLKNDNVKKEFDDKTRGEYIEEAKKYIVAADRLAERDKEQSSKYVDRQRYIGYLYRRAFAVGGLASVGEVEVSDYEDAFDLFFKESNRQDNHNGSGFRPFAYVLQAKFSQLIGQDVAIAQEFLKKALAEVEADPVPQANELVDFIADKSFDADGRFSWHAIHSVRSVSPEFDTFVSDIELANK